MEALPWFYGTVELAYLKVPS